MLTVFAGTLNHFRIQGCLSCSIWLRPALAVDHVRLASIDFLFSLFSSSIGKIELWLHSFSCGFDRYNFGGRNLHVSNSTECSLDKVFVCSQFIGDSDQWKMVCVFDWCVNRISSRHFFPFVFHARLRLMRYHHHHHQTRSL